MTAQYVRHATKAEKLALALDKARTDIIIAVDVSAIVILDKTDGSWTLTLEFSDQTSTKLERGEVRDGDRYAVDVSTLKLTHTAQAGLTLKLLVEKQQAEFMVKG